MKFNEHPHSFNISKAFMRVSEASHKIVYFDLRYNEGTLVSFNKNRNSITKALIVLQHGKKSPSIIKLESLLEGKDNQLKMVLYPDKHEIALYIKSGSDEYADYFSSKFCKNSRLWALFELQNGIYGVLFDSAKSKVDMGFQWLDYTSPNPFDIMSMGIKPTFKFEN